ncbi:class I SAM-dependent methyltransferase [Stappia sp.]|jgi:SAM-dependent methyltransferase|uniref:class I SAM-dependent methyltransferase n=1 Tax=Stappia sp. TaxID=1870903 RepID=UPI003A99F76B
MSGTKGGDGDFSGRRDAARTRLDDLFGAKGGARGDRASWFHAVYETAGRDPAAVPWADLAPKPELVDWLKEHPGEGRRALDVACGLGDNAEALAAAGYRTTAFDLAPEAIRWAGERFPQGTVDYRVADLLDPPTDWVGGFDLVHECYTLQALDGDLREAAFPALARLLAPGGRLLVLTRTRGEGMPADGPPWPLTPGELHRFETLGLTRVTFEPYEIRKGARVIAHVRALYRKD